MKDSTYFILAVLFNYWPAWLIATILMAIYYV